MKRFIAFWLKGTNYCNVPFQSMNLVENVIFLYRDGIVVGQFDMGFVDLWYVTEEKPS